MSWGMVAGAAIAAVGTTVAADKAAGAQEDASNLAAKTQTDMFNITNGQQAPWRDAGSNALSQIATGMGTGPAAGSLSQPYQPYHAFNAGDLKSNLAPNYQWQLDQGMGAVNNQNSVSGGLVSGNALKGIADYSQGLAGSAYQNAFNNYNTSYLNGFNTQQTQQQNIFNRLASIAQLGQTSVGQTGTAATAAGSNIGSAQLAGGAAQAAGYVGMGNAVSKGIDNATGMYALNNMMNPSGAGGSGLGGSGGYMGQGGDYGMNQ